METDILGGASMAELATAGVVDMVADAVVATIAITATPKPKPNLIHLDSILLLIGITFF